MAAAGIAMSGVGGKASISWSGLCMDTWAGLAFVYSGCFAPPPPLQKNADRALS